MRSAAQPFIDPYASELVANGDIKLESGVDVVRLTETGVLLSNGKELPADVVVYATGASGSRLRHDQGPRPVGGHRARDR